MRSRQTGSSAGATRVEDSIITESRAHSRSAPSASKVRRKPDARWVRTRAFAPNTASGICIRTPMTRADPHMHGLSDLLAP